MEELNAFELYLISESLQTKINELKQLRCDTLEKQFNGVIDQYNTILKKVLKIMEVDYLEWNH